METSQIGEFRIFFVKYFVKLPECKPHYSKSPIFVPKIQFWLNEFSPKFLFDNFSREIKVVNS